MAPLGLKVSFWDLYNRGWSANGSTGSDLFLFWDLYTRGWLANGSTGCERFLLTAEKNDVSHSWDLIGMSLAGVVIKYISNESFL